MDEYYSMIKAEHDANNAWSAEQAQKAMDYQTYMSNTAHQREVADLKAAGLNPVLSAGGQGATTGSGITAQRSDENVTALYGLAKQAIDANIRQAEALAQTARYASGSGSGSGSGSNSLLGVGVDVVADWIYRKTGIKPEHTKALLNMLIPNLDGYDTEKMLAAVEDGQDSFLNWLEVQQLKFRKKWLTPGNQYDQFMHGQGINSSRNAVYDGVTALYSLTDLIDAISVAHHRNYHAGGDRRRSESVN